MENNKKLTEQKLRELWYLYESEHINDLTQDEITQINNFIKENPEKCCDMWEIIKR
ncbi:hypothetical protein JXK06_00600 [Patescibacteria group bacterium]|nr:hypothetical protein [Patescibacteria group bacterium]